MNRSALNVFLNLAMDFDLIHCRGDLTGVSEMHGRGGLGDFPFPTTFVFVSWWRGNCSFPICWRGRSVMGTLTGARSHAFPPGGLGSTPPAAEPLLHFPVSVPRAGLILPSPFPTSCPSTPTPKRGVHCPCLGSGLLYLDATLLLFFPLFYYYFFFNPNCRAGKQRMEKKALCRACCRLCASAVCLRHGTDAAVAPPRRSGAGSTPCPCCLVGDRAKGGAPQGSWTWELRCPEGGRAGTGTHTLGADHRLPCCFPVSPCLC